jgi:septum formation protein
VRIHAGNPLVLGSQSPRRKDLLGRLGVPFIVRPADTDETPRSGEAPDAYLDRVVLAKLTAVCERLAADEAAEPAPVLVADTTVIAPDGAILGKPADDGESLSMLRRLSGAVHAVSTRFALGTSTAPQAAPALAHAETVTTRVTFRRLADAEIERYVATGEGRDKAGSYAIQGLAAIFVARIDGSVTGVVGLPLAELCVALRRLGWQGA